MDTHMVCRDVIFENLNNVQWKMDMKYDIYLLMNKIHKYNDK